MQAGGGRLVVGGANALLQLWSVGHTPDTPTVTLEGSMELDGGAFSGVFDSRIELVRRKEREWEKERESFPPFFPLRVWLAQTEGQCGVSTGWRAAV